MIKITGKVVYVDVEGGFWGIVDEKGSKWVAVPMPEQLKQEGAKVHITALELEDQDTIFMWGTAVKILSFHTLPLLD